MMCARIALASETLFDAAPVVASAGQTLFFFR
jgi:hypothetical protein